MIIIRMSGGLGNQMFQYALYLQLRALGREVCFDDWTQYDEAAFAGSSQKRRKKALDTFGIEYPRATAVQLETMTDASMAPLARIRRKLKGRHSLERDDRDFIFDPAFLEREDGYFCGGFQSARYFAGAEDAVRNAFTFPESLLKEENPQKAADDARESKIRKETRQMADRILAADSHSVSIHLRFGDYLDKSAIYGGICTDAYYDAAIARVLQEDPDAVFFIFSNDPRLAGDWVRVRAERFQGVRTRQRFILVTGRDEDHGCYDLYLMTLCRFHIIANSSFSWWGSWLCRREDKKIFAPSIWNNEKDGSELARTDIFTEEMIRINPEGRLVTETPLVSVIVTAYNVAPYIRTAMNSVCAQTWQNLEIIAVDDGSTDGTGELLDQAAGEDARIRVIHKENGGVSAARNAGLAAAHGEYVCFVDGDDFAHPQMIEAMARGLLQSGADMASVNYAEVSGAGDREDPEGGPSATNVLGRSVLLTGEQAIRAFIHAGIEGADGTIVLHSAVWSKLFDRRVLEGNTFPEGTSAEDIPFTTRALCRSGKVLYLPDVLYDYMRGREDSIMNSNRARRTLEEEIPAWHTHLDVLRQAGFDRLAEESEYYYYRRLLSYEEDYRNVPETQPEAEALQEKLLERKDRILELTAQTSWGRKGDRERLKLFVQSPDRYYALSRLYSRTVVAWKRKTQR